jgi:hypothetical protein
MKVEYKLSVKRSESLLEDFYSLLSCTIKTPNWVWHPSVYNQHPLEFKSIKNTPDSIIFEFDSDQTSETLEHIKRLIHIGMKWYIILVELNDIVYNKIII